MNIDRFVLAFAGFIGASFGAIKLASKRMVAIINSIRWA